MPTPWGFETQKDVERAAEVVRQFERTDRTLDGKRRRLPRLVTQRFRHGFLKENLAAPSEPFGPPAFASVREFERDPDTDVLSYVRDFTVYNYDTSLTAEEGTYLKSERINGLDSIYWIGCEPTYVVLESEDEEDLTDEEGNLLLLDI